MAETRTLCATDGIALMPFGETHLPGAVRLTGEAGWPHREDDWRLTLSVSRGVAAVRDGEVVGTALCSAFGAVATLNMIVVSERLRGAGLGRRLMDAVLALAGERACRLVGTDIALPLYRKLGFEAVGRILQHQGTALTATPGQPVGTGDPARVPALARLDAAATGMEREGLLRAIAGRGEVLETEGGFALLREFGRGAVIGPIVARTDAAARALMSEAARRRAGAFLRIDMPEVRSQAVHAEGLGLAHVGGGTTMVRGAVRAPSSDHESYALVSQALG